jgi:hypothetical protein
VTVVGERLNHVGAGVHELPVQPLHYLRVIQHDLGNERSRLKVAPPLALEKVTFCAHDSAMLQGLEQIRHAILQARLAPGSGDMQGAAD